MSTTMPNSPEEKRKWMRNSPEETQWKPLRNLNEKFKMVGGKSDFMQQNLRCWNPILTVGTALPYFKIAMFIHIVLGLFCFFMNFEVHEHQFDYTDCFQHGNDGVRCAEIIAKDPKASCQCHVEFSLNFIPNDVYIYYSIENMYQNYMSYVNSIDYVQMNGQLNRTPKVRCLDRKTFKTVAPCGAVANSFFNDTFELKKFVFTLAQHKTWNQGSKHPNLKPYLYPITIQRKGISFKQYQLFKNPPLTAQYPTLESWFENTVKPSNWPKPVYELDLEDPENNGFQHEPLIVWMRVAPFSTFRKVYGKVVHKNNSLVTAQGLRSGNYLMIINYTYPVEQFNGRKLIIISNVSPLGGKNYFLAYLFGATVIAEFIIILFFQYLDKKYGKISKQVYVYIRKYNKRGARGASRKPKHMKQSKEEAMAIIQRVQNSKTILRRKKLRKIPRKLSKKKVMEDSAETGTPKLHSNSQKIMKSLQKSIGQTGGEALKSPKRDKSFVL